MYSFLGPSRPVASMEGEEGRRKEAGEGRERREIV
jgi:hypothetical protein